MQSAPFNKGFVILLPCKRRIRSVLLVNGKSIKYQYNHFFGDVRVLAARKKHACIEDN